MLKENFLAFLSESMNIYCIIFKYDINSRFSQMPLIRLTKFLFLSNWSMIIIFNISSVQSLSHVWLFATPWIAACRASLSISNSLNSLKLMPIELVIPSSHLILCRPLFPLPPIPPSIRVFSIESTLGMRWPKYWSFNLSISPSKEHPGSPLGWNGWLSL